MAVTSKFLFEDYPLQAVMLFSLLILFGPLYFLYVKTLVTGKKSGSRELIHFIPFLLFQFYLLNRLIIGELKGINLEHSHTDSNMPVLFAFFLLLTALSGPVYFLMSINLFKRLKSSLSNNYSSLEVDPLWLRKLSFIFGIVWTILILIAVIHHLFGMFSLSFCTDGLALSLAVLIILLGYFGIRQNEIFVEKIASKQPFVTEPVKKYASSDLKYDEAKVLEEKLNDYMNINKPWLDPEITLPKLSEQLGVSSHHISRVINENLNSTFFDMINKKRVEEVINKLNDPEYCHYSLLGIAMESGFNSKTAFNRLFKKYTGDTPSSFKTKGRASIIVQ